jgi:dTDP-4-dehydrorhamnose reductase
MSSNRKGMDRPRALVTGGEGFLGGYLLERLAGSYEVYGGSRSGAHPGPGSAIPLELTDKTSIESVRRLAPRYVVHNAALTRPEVCEEEPDRAHAVNVEGTRWLAEAVESSCIRFVYCSTDLVFDGSRSLWSESDAPAPLMVYGRTKLAGEEAARAVLGERVVVARLALLYGKGRGRSAGRTFTERMLLEAREGRAVRLFEDQYRSPLYVEDAASGIEAALDWPEALAVVHLGGPERISRFDMGVETLDVFGLDRSLAVPARMEDVPARVPRPGDVSLDIRRARSKGFDSLSVREGLSAMRDAYR